MGINPKTFFIRTFGCQMNKNDSDIIARIFTEQGFVQTDDVRIANIIVVNTCSVREHAEQRALGYISTQRKWKTRRNSIIVVAGCMARRLSASIAARFPFVDLILGPDSYRQLPVYLSQIAETGTRIIDTEFYDETYCGFSRSPAKVTDYVSIMRGCDNFCSYCVVPFVRGRARSRDSTDILREIEALVAGGVKDITLLGQNVNEYKYEDTDFADLLEHIAVIPGVCRIRFLTSHPKDLTPKIVSTVKAYAALCEWFHLPVQSGNDRILALMNRKYTRQHYIDLVHTIRTEIPDATVTTDVIAGFPGETEEEFQETLGLLRDIEFDDAYTYRYSARNKTKASEYVCLPEHVIQKRLRRLIDVQSDIILKKTKAMIGKTYEVLFETRTPQGASRGKTRGNKDVIVEHDIACGELHKVLIQQVRGRTPVGKVLQ